MTNLSLVCHRLIRASTSKFLKRHSSIWKSFSHNRCFSVTFPNRKVYEHDGNTIAVVINKKSSETITISSVRNSGFVLSSEAELVGATILFPHAVFSWSVTCAADVNEESLTLFKLLEPKLDILVFGFGLPQEYTPQVRQNFTQICKKFKIRFEALPTEQAAGLFNFFSYEERFAAAALIPPKSLDPLRFRGKQLQFGSENFEEDDEDEKKTNILQENKEYRKLLT